jgi:Recombinase
VTCAWSAVAAILGNPRYTGHQVWNRQRKDEVLLDVHDVALGFTTKQRWNQAGDWIWSEQPTHEPLIDTTTFERAQALRRTRVAHAQRAPRRTPRPYLLRGLLYCGICHRRMQGSWNNDAAYYRCMCPYRLALSASSAVASSLLTSPIAARWRVISSWLRAAKVPVAEPTATGRVIAAWPSFALIAAYELLMRQVRRSAAASGKAQLAKPRPQISPREDRGRDVQGGRRHSSGSAHDAESGGRRGASRDMQWQAWQWALANRAGDGSLPSGREIARQYGRHERWGRLVKRSGAAGELAPGSESSVQGLHLVGQPVLPPRGE